MKKLTTTKLHELGAAVRDVAKSTEQAKVGEIHAIAKIAIDAGIAGDAEACKAVAADAWPDETKKTRKARDLVLLFTAEHADKIVSIGEKAAAKYEKLSAQNASVAVARKFRTAMVKGEKLPTQTAVIEAIKPKDSGPGRPIPKTKSSAIEKLEAICKQLRADNVGNVEKLEKAIDKLEWPKDVVEKESAPAEKPEVAGDLDSLVASFQNMTADQQGAVMAQLAVTARGGKKKKKGKK